MFKRCDYHEAIKENFKDDLEDLTWMQRFKFKKLYHFDLERKNQRYSQYLTSLRKNSQQRIEENKNYQNFLKEIEKQDLEEMLGNLLDNACKWARTLVEVTVERYGPDEILIHVDDDGKGLSEEEKTAALQRGVRLDETAPGTGLGLSIVNEIAEMHKGSLELSKAPLGGLRATLRLPSAP